MAEIGSLVISLQARTEALERQLNRANGLIRKLQKETRAVGPASQRAERQSVRAFTRIGLGASGVTARVVAASRAMRAFAAAAAGFLAASFVTRTVAAADAIGKMADRLGVGVEELQALRFAAGQAGIALNTFDTGLQRFIRRTAEAAQGTGEAKDTLRQLGIQLTDTSGQIRPATDLLGDVADAFRRLPTQADRVRAAFKLFDTEGVAFVNILRLGSAGLTTLTEKAQRLGIVLEDRLIRQAEAANDQLDIIQKVITTRVTAAVLGLTPKIITLGESFARIVQRFADTNAAIDNLTSREAALGDFFRGVVQTANAAANAVGLVVEKIGDLAALITRSILGRPPAPGIVGINPNLPPIRRPTRLRINIPTSRTSKEEKAEADRIKRIQQDLEREQAAALERGEQRLASFLVRVRQRNVAAQQHLEQVQRVVTGFFDAFSSAVSNAAIGVAQGTQTISQAIRNMANSISASLLSSATNAVIGQLQRLTIAALSGAAGGAAAGSSGGFQPAVLPLSSSAAVGRTATPQVTVINVADEQQALRIAALEQAQGRSVTVHGLAQQVRTEGNGNPLVQSLRDTLRP